MKNNKYEIRAEQDDETIIVYQAYRPEIAIAAVENQRFVPPFKMDRMTWIKPSFLWMMYRCGWAEKEGQEHVLAIRMKKEGFDWALENACLSSFNDHVYESRETWKEKLNTLPVRIQWDPEKNIFLEKQDYKSIQIGLSGIAAEKYVNEWIISIEDVTKASREIHRLVKEGRVEEAKALLPQETVYRVMERAL